MPLKCHFCIRRMDNCVGGKPIENLGVSKLSSRTVTLTVHFEFLCAEAPIVTQKHSFICIFPSTPLEAPKFYNKL